MPASLIMARARGQQYVLAEVVYIGLGKFSTAHDGIHNGSVANGDRECISEDIASTLDADTAKFDQNRAKSPHSATVLKATGYISWEAATEFLTG